MKTRDIIVGIIIAALVILYLFQKDQKESKPVKPIVSIYLSENRNCIDPIFDRFEKEYNITVRRFYLDDANKTHTFFKALFKNNASKVDIYWSKDPIEAMLLKKRGMLFPYHSPSAQTIPKRFKDVDGTWTGLAARLRLLYVRRGARPVPTGIEDFIRADFEKHGVIATPSKGSQRLYTAALLKEWGADRTEAFLKKLKHSAAIVSSDQESLKKVKEGEYDFTLLDSDRLFTSLRQKEPILILFPDQRSQAPGSLLIPDVLMLLRQAPHPKNAKKLIDYLLRPETESYLAHRCGKFPLHPDIKTPTFLPSIAHIKTMNLDYNEVAEELPILEKILWKWQRSDIVPSAN